MKDDASKDAERAARAARRRAWTGGVAHDFSEMEQVDLELWLSATPGERVQGLTELIREMACMGGERGPAPRPQKSVGGARPRGS